MRRILVFSDLHACKSALSSIAPLLDEVDLSVFCGDMLGYGEDIDYCVDYVLDEIDLVVLGNQDRLAVTDEDLSHQHPAVQTSIKHARKALTKDQVMKISSLPRELWHEDLYVTHSIGDDYLRNEEDVERIFARMHEDTRYAFFGHTHEQMVWRNGGKTVVNPGSITKGRRGFHRGCTIINGNDIRMLKFEDIL